MGCQQSCDTVLLPLGRLLLRLRAFMGEVIGLNFNLFHFHLKMYFKCQETKCNFFLTQLTVPLASKN